MEQLVGMSKSKGEKIQNKNPPLCVSTNTLKTWLGYFLVAAGGYLFFLNLFFFALPLAFIFLFFFVGCVVVRDLRS